MSYSEAGKRATIKYRRTKRHRIEIEFKQSEFEEIVRPAIEKSGLPVATYVKAAIMEKIQRESN